MLGEFHASADRKVAYPVRGFDPIVIRCEIVSCVVVEHESAVLPTFVAIDPGIAQPHMLIVEIARP